ncbi:MAG: tripartite tricarboxylate transporter substrate binding protein [Alphaproteobacteria bacterium]|nr:tripartite tricarboxylate transporter substrate binding protein [Alphaproteobacteria bacterium]
MTDTSMRLRRRTLLAGAAATSLAAPAIAQGEWPTKPVRVVIAYPPGGPTDISTRLVLDKVQSMLGQPFIFDNRGGASGAIGAEIVKNAPADGYTILGMTVAMVCITPHLQPIPYDPVKDFVHVARTGTSWGALAAHPSVPASTVAELVAHVKANPGKVHWGSSGMATITQLFGETFKFEAGIDLVHVPYKGSAQALQAVLAGEVQLQFDQLVLPYVKSGKLKGLAMLGEQRHPDHPTIPTLREAGYGKDMADSWYGVMAPAGTPRPIVDKLSKAIGEAMQDPAVKEKMHAGGLRPTYLNADDMRDRVAVESKAFADVIKKANIKI